MPQAIERLLATPRISPRLPRIRPEASTMITPDCRAAETVRRGKSKFRAVERTRRGNQEHRDGPATPYGIGTRAASSGEVFRIVNCGE